MDLDALYSHSITPFMQLMENGDIINLESNIAYERGEKLGYLSNFKISDSLDEPYYRLSKEEGIVYFYSIEDIIPCLRLVGDLTNVDEIVFLGLCFYFLDILR